MSRSTFLTMRAVFALGFLVCAGLIAYVVYVQYVLHIEPCPLCILQRVAFIVAGLVFLIGALHGPRAGGRKVYAALVTLCTAAGAAVSLRHLWLQSLPPDQVPSCGPGLGYMLNAFPLSQTIKMVFTGSGECAEVNWSFLGLSMPAWALVCYIALTVWAWYGARRVRVSAFAP